MKKKCAKLIVGVVVGVSVMIGFLVVFWTAVVSLGEAMRAMYTVAGRCYHRVKGEEEAESDIFEDE